MAVRVTVRIAGLLGQAFELNQVGREARHERRA